MGLKKIREKVRRYQEGNYAVMLTDSEIGLLFSLIDRARECLDIFYQCSMHEDLSPTADSIAKAEALIRELEEAKGFERDESERRSQMYSALLRVASSLNYFDAVRIAEEAIKKDREL